MPAVDLISKPERHEDPVRLIDPPSIEPGSRDEPAPREAEPAPQVASHRLRPAADEPLDARQEK
jgi:hypothetical protein